MKIVHILTHNALKFGEISEMVALYGARAIQIFSADFDHHQHTQQQLPVGERAHALVQEQTQLHTLADGRLEHESHLRVVHLQVQDDGLALYTPAQQWMERVRGRLLTEPRLTGSATDGPQDQDSTVYNWDARFVPQGSTQSLHALKEKGLKVSARQLAVGAWLQHWLHYSQPVTWAHTPATHSLLEWVKMQPLLNTPSTKPTRALVLRVHEQGGWFKAAENRREKHYWWPGLNAGIPMTPKKDAVHELTFLVHDLIHWTMPDVIPSGHSREDRRLYLVTRMMSEAITLVMADMLFIHQALQDGLLYDVQKRKIYPLYSSTHDVKTWCNAMAHYAIRGDDGPLAALARTPEALLAFKDKYAPFFEEDLRWTAHNAEHLLHWIDPRWIQLYEQFAQHCTLGLTTTADYKAAWSEDDAILVDQVFEMLWARHWSAPTAANAATDPFAHSPVLVNASPEIPLEAQNKTPLHSDEHATRHRFQRWFLGQLALTFRVDDLPLSGCVRDAIVRACLGGSSAQALSEATALWDNYVDALEGLSRISGNDNALFKSHYPIVPPLYVSYDLHKTAYEGIAAMWHKVR